MRDEQTTWEGPANAQVSVIFSTGDEGRVSDDVPRTVAAGLVGAGMRVVRLPCVGGDLESRDERISARIHEMARGTQTLVLAGCSRGARVSAGHVDELGAVGLVAFAYPFHARTDSRPLGRDRELGRIRVPVLLVQGTRDSHGNREQVRGYRLPPNIVVHWMEEANHALRPRPQSGLSGEVQLAEAVTRMVEFIQAL